MRLDRHLRSFAKGAASGGPGVSGQVVQTPAEVMAKARGMLKSVLLVQVVWFLCFIAGGVMLVWTAWENTHRPAVCPGAVRLAPGVIASCAHDSYLWPVLLILVGIVGLLVTGYVATRLAVKYLGAGAMAFLRGGRFFTGPMDQRPGYTGAQDVNGGLPDPSGDMSPRFTADLPPGTAFQEGAPPQKGGPEP
jgi:hypothetical protein